MWLVADFNNSPEAVRRSGIDAAIEAKVISAGDDHGTRRQPGGGASVIDFFMVDNEMADAVESCSVQYQATSRPHLPVRLAFHTIRTSISAANLPPGSKNKHFKNTPSLPSPGSCNF